jgi:RNA polymerase sigma factor (sigma-70 family)
MGGALETKSESMPAERSQQIDMETESDEDLLIYMSLEQDDHETARKAWAEFYRRHVEYVHGQCRKVLYERLRHRYDGHAVREMATDLTDDVMMKIFEKAHTFKLQGSREPDQMRRQVRAWIGAISHNAVCEWLSGGRHECGTVSLEDILAMGADSAPPSPVAACVASILETLSSKERMVLDAYMSFFDPRTGKGRLSNQAAKELASALGLTPASLRQIKSRLQKRLKQEIESKCLGKPRGAL